jgi:excisionase family DNA binding protein
LKEFFSVSEVAAYLNVTRQTVNNWIKNGRFKAYQLPSGTYKVHHNDFLQFLNANNLPVDPNVFPGRSMKVLVIDDDPFISDYLEEAFRDFCPDC